MELPAYCEVAAEGIILDLILRHLCSFVAIELLSLLRYRAISNSLAGAGDLCWIWATNRTQREPTNHRHSPDVVEMRFVPFPGRVIPKL